MQASLNILADREVLISLIEKLLTDILEQTRSLERGNSLFHCKQLPTITIGFYLNRIAKFAHCSNSVFVAALIYFDRLQQRIAGFIINYFCIHRLLICSVMIAAKFYQDFYYKNDYYAKIGGISKPEMNALEIEFLKNLDHSLFINQEEFQIYVLKLETYAQVHKPLPK